MKRIVLLSLFLSAHAYADDVDTHAFEYLDVVETADGSVWKGVLVEQTPNVQYKIATSDGSTHVIKAADVTRLSKQRNPAYRTASAVGSSAPFENPETHVSLPAPLAHTGLRAEAELDLVFPTGTLGQAGFLTSFAPTVRFGYETLLGNIGLTGGFQTRFTYWRLPGMTANAAWLLEPQLYGRGALHVGRVAPYLGVSLGTDINYEYSDNTAMSNTNLGFGMNLSLGLQIAPTPGIAIDVGGDYHPGTDTLKDQPKLSAEYFALRVGAQARF